MAAGGVELLPRRQVDLALRGSLAGRGDRLCRASPVVRGLPVQPKPDDGVRVTVAHHRVINTSL